MSNWICLFSNGAIEYAGSRYGCRTDGHYNRIGFRGGCKEQVT